MREPTGNGQPNGELSLPTRALRKGTRSCAECKRRKTRCFFGQPMDEACVACQRRGIPCIGQELMDVPLPNLTEVQNIVERLKRAELMPETISKGTYHEGQGSRSLCPQWDRTIDQERSDTPLDAGNTLGTDPVPQPQTAERGPLNHPYPKYAELCRVLHARLPSQADVKTLFGASRAVVFVQAICNHYGELFHEGDIRPIEGMAILPSITDHPIVIARKLLQLALCIQQLDPSFDKSTLNLGLCASDAMDIYFTVATSMVTCHEDLLDSIEGLECLIYEGVFLVNSGNLRRALVCLRRASTLAQFMGLHRKTPYKSLKKHGPETHVSGTVIWAHIAYLERYICLILGMPTSISRVRFASDEPAEGDTSADWFEKTQIDIFERIIDRNQDRNYDDLTATLNIDYDLNRMASQLPAKWWAPIDLTQSISTKDMMEKVINAQMQIVHYNMLTVLHLPYLLWHTDDKSFEYSKTTCIYTSREVLNRFITFRSIVKLVTCCRPVDFCALTASLTLLLTYLNGHRQGSGWTLAHQRLGDRALIEAAMETMDELNELNNDELSRNTAQLTRKLLDIEADYARGGRMYNGRIDDNIHPQDEAVGDEEHSSFNLKIPYFGTVKLTLDGATPAQNLDTVPTSAHPVSLFAVDQSQSPSAQAGPHSHYAPDATQLDQHLPGLNGHPPYELTYQTANGDFDWDMPDLMATADDWAFQGVDSAFFDAVYMGNPTNAASQDETRGDYTFCI